LAIAATAMAAVDEDKDSDKARDSEEDEAVEAPDGEEIDRRLIDPDCAPRNVHYYGYR